MSKELNDAIDAWRLTREPRWADVADWASRAALAAAPRPLVGAGKKKADREAWEALEKKREALDMPRLVQALLKMTAADAGDRIRVLARRDDPQLFSELKKVLEGPPWRANVYKDFVTAVIESANPADPRIAPAFADLAKRYRAIIETAVGDWTSIKLAKAAQQLEAVKTRPLSTAEEAQLAAAEARFPKELAALKHQVREKNESQNTDEELLAAIYAAPGDDGPRLVFADALSERGDPRGEFIAIQVRHAAGERTPQTVQRELELLRDAKLTTAWGLPLSRGADVEFERGFPARLALRKATASKIKGEAAFATVTALRGLDQLSAKMACGFLEQPSLAGVQSVGALTADLMAALEPKPRPWREVRLRDAVPPALAPHLSAVRVLRLETLREPIAAESLGCFSAIEELTLSGSTKFTPAHLEPFSQLHTLSLSWGAQFPEALSKLPKLRSLEVFWQLTPGSIAGLPLKQLRILGVYVATAEIRALVDAIPGLERLVIGRLKEPSLDPMLASLEGTSLKSVEVDLGHSAYRMNEGRLTVTRIGYDAAQFVDVLTPSLAAGRIRSARVVPNLRQMPVDARLAPLEAVLSRHGLTLERDWLE